MISDSFSTDQEMILERLGDKPIEAWASAVEATKADLKRYRSTLPDLATPHTPRGLANVIHDWHWKHLARQIDGMDGVKIVDSGSLRVLLIRDQIRIRVKRLSATGSVATYLTSSALAFYRQGGQLSLFGVPPEIKLVFGYLWDSSIGEIGSATVSYPLGTQKSLWVYEIPKSATHKGEPLPTEPPSPNVIPGEEGPESMAG